MFTKINKNAVSSSDGYVVESVGDYKVKYCDEDYECLVDVGGGVDKRNEFLLLVYGESLREVRNRRMDKDLEIKILDRIHVALKFLNISNEISYP